MSGHRRPAHKRSSGSVSVSSGREKWTGKKGQSKKRAAQRSLNAFRVGDQSEGSGDEAGGIVKPEDDEEIDSDEAFESGDEDKFDTYKFSGSTKKAAKRKRGDVVQAPKRTARDALEVDLAEESDHEQPRANSHRLEQKRPRLQQVRKLHSSSDEESASDFEDDGGDDLMDLSEMLGPAQSEKSREGANPTDRGKVLTLKPSQQYQTTDLETNDDNRKDDNVRDSEDDNQSCHSWSSSESMESDDEAKSNMSSFEDDLSAEEATPLDALEKFVSQLEKKRKSQDRETIQTPLEKKSQVPRIQESNERAKESEYNLALSSQGNKLDLESMMGSLGGQHGKILRKTQALQAPLAKPIQDRIDRGAAYDTVKEQITKWQPAVRQLREAAVLKFPLIEQSKVQANNNSLASTFKPTNELETSISNILKDSGMQSENSISRFEDLELAKLSVEEVQKRRADLAIMRDLLFRQEQKAKRQSKIKSKAFRRVHRKEKEKMRLAMEEANPDTAGALKDAESIRARERMELRHKNTGKWAQKMLQRADHGEGSRAAITEQLQRGEDLERKIRGYDNNAGTSDSDSDDSKAHETADEPLPDRGVFSMKFMRDADAMQASLLSGDDDQATDSAFTHQPSDQGRRSFKPVTSQSIQKSTNTVHTDTTNKKKSLASSRVVAPDQVVVQKSSMDPEDNPWLSGTIVAKKDRGSLITKDTDDSLKFVAKLKKRKEDKRQLQQHQGRISSPKLDVAHKLPLKDSFMDMDGGSEEEKDLPDSRRIALRQADLVGRAFAGDDVVAEFETAKESIIKEDAPQDIDETLPGWGSWTGDGVKKSRNARKFIKHVPGVRNEQRKDLKLQHVIINEKRLKQAKPYMSQSVPYPFENKEQYERSLNLPIGPEFTTRTNFQKQIMPHVVTKQGKVVAPMDRPFKT